MKDPEELNKILAESQKLFHKANEWSLTFRPEHREVEDIGRNDFRWDEDAWEREADEEHDGESFEPSESDTMEIERVYPAEWIITRGSRLIAKLADEKWAKFVYSACLDRQEKINWSDDSQDLLKEMSIFMGKVMNYSATSIRWIADEEAKIMKHRDFIRKDLEMPKP